MRRLLAAAALVALVVAGAAAASEQRPTLAEFEGEIMCPVCGTTIDQSDAPVAQQMKMFIRRQIAAGDSKGEIEDALVAAFGEEVLAAPPKEGFNLLAWVLPLLGVALAVPAIGYAAWRWSRVREPAAASERLEPEAEQRLERELARFES